MNWQNLEEILSLEKPYRRKQIYQAIFQHLILDWEEATSLPKELRRELTLKFPLEISAEVIANKNSFKAAIKLADNSLIETVLIENRDNRHTVCLSSQLGCPVACTFCATGSFGFKRNLTFYEILEQLLFFARQLKNKNQRIDNVVFMGMGEPFLNWLQVKKAIEIINNNDYFNVGARSISISTVGIVEGINELAKFPLQVNLAVSLHAADDKLRNKLIPSLKKYSLAAIISSLNKYLSRTNRQVMIEYLMIKDINDRPEDIDKLIELLDQLDKRLIMINLLPYNPTGKFQPTSYSKINKIKNDLLRQGIKTTIRESLGQEISGACGQLAQKNSI